jgi:hypothetical protein
MPSRLAIFVLILVSCAYVFIFVPPNLTGAKDPNILAAFSDELPGYGTDESAQFGIAMRMTSRGGTLDETLQNALFYGYYQEGYTFFLLSALTIFPLRLANKLFPGSISTTAYMVVLRQLSPILMVTAIMLLVYVWTGFKSTAKSVALFVLMGAVPAVFLNNMVSRPDALVTLFVALTIFSLSKDKLRCGGWYYVAAVSCGLAIGTEVIGLLLCLVLAVYLVAGVMHKAVTSTGALKHGVVFAAVMVLTVLMSNPLLLMPSVARQYVGMLTEHALRNAWEWRQEASGPLAWYREAGLAGSPSLQDAFGPWWLYALILSASLLGIAYRRENRLLNIIIMTWTVGASSYLLVSKDRDGAHCFIPVAVPLVSCIGNVFSLPLASAWGRNKTAAFVAPMVVCALPVAFYVPANLTAYRDVLNRENTSASLRFYRQLNDIYLSRLAPDDRVSVVREVEMYLPPSSKWDDDVRRERFGYDYVNDARPDLVLLRTNTIRRQSDPNYVSRVYPTDREQWLRSYDLYRDATAGSLSGFCKVLETDFGVAFLAKPRCASVTWTGRLR